MFAAFIYYEEPSISIKSIKTWAFKKSHSAERGPRLQVLMNAEKELAVCLSGKEERAGEEGSD